ncbi:hypothetical protein CY34DRAFT_78402, partial [Suillus luteus UH-Slu-Lm8-n1]
MGLYKAPTAVSSTAPTVPTKVTFEDIAISFSEEANRQSSQLKLTKPGSEYANAASHSHSHSQSQQAPVVNPATGVRIHKQNPKGVVCDNPVCTGLPCSLTHNREHCMQQGGGMEGKAPWHNKPSSPKGKKEVAAATTETTAASSSKPSTETLAEQPQHHLLCAVIEEITSSPTETLSPSSEDIACIAGSLFSTILDTGTTSTLITDGDLFWSFSPSSSVTVKTANHGSLPTSGRGECIADLTLKGETDCLHAPGALINLLSVSHMLRKGWGCNFLPNLSCELSHKGELLGNIPMHGNL